MVALKPPLDQDVCAVCGKNIADTAGFMRVYLKEGRLEFCSLECAHLFNEDPARYGGAPDSALESDRRAWTDRWVD